MDTSARGAAIAALLAGAWRRQPDAPRVDIALEVLPLLVAGGAAGLAWHRLRHSPRCPAPRMRELQQHYRLQALQMVDRAGAIGAVLARLHSAGVEPLLIKGWSSALLYPEPGLRPSGDVDLCVPPDRLAAAAQALSGPLPCPVDLHAGIPDLPDRRWAEVWRRSLSVAVGGTEVRVLGPEDQLRLLCVHQVRHGLARPLWLCDVAARLESLPADFDLDSCLHGRRHLSAWTACVIALACRLLGARTVLGTREVPPWVERAVRWCWGIEPDRPLGYYLCRPAEIVRRVCYHGIRPQSGSAPVADALSLGLGPLTPPSLLLLQMTALARRKVRTLWRLATTWQRRKQAALTIHEH